MMRRLCRKSIIALQEHVFFAFFSLVSISPAFSRPPNIPQPHPLFFFRYSSLQSIKPSYLYLPISQAGGLEGGQIAGSIFCLICSQYMPYAPSHIHTPYSYGDQLSLSCSSYSFTPSSIRLAPSQSAALFDIDRAFLIHKACCLVFFVFSAILLSIRSSSPFLITSSSSPFDLLTFNVLYRNVYIS